MDERTQELLTEVAEQQKQLIEVATRILHSEKKKDKWDKLGTISAFLSTVVIAVVTLIATQMFAVWQSERDGKLRQQEIKVSKFEIVQGLMPYVTATTAAHREAAYAAIRALGEDSLVIALATPLAPPGNVSAEVSTLSFLMATSSGPTRAYASKALDRIFAKQGYLDSLRSDLRDSLTTRGIAEVMTRFQFDGSPDCSLEEAQRMLEFLDVPRSAIVSHGSEIVSGDFGFNQQIMIWLTSYGKRGQYGIRFGLRDGSYIGNNETLVHIDKPVD